MLGLYIHIPFCHARCGYCDFVTFTGKEDRIDQYVDSLCKEITIASSPAATGRGSMDATQQASARRVADSPLTTAGNDVSTVFFGGGTPSLLEPQHVSQILDTIRSHFKLDPSAEITMEANPESITEAKARGWRQAGVNRLSIGLQAFDDALLKAMDRLHTVDDFVRAFGAARSAGFDNLNIDLIYGFPNQSLKSWQETLEKTVAMKPEHLSLYALKVEEHTPFSAAGVQTDDDAQAEMYGWARTFLKEAGYPQYEISNFSKPGYACRHNLVYWRQQDYLGIGVGAVGCVGNTRWENHKNLPDYERDLTANQLPRFSTEILDLQTRRFERLMLGLRLREGVEWMDSDPTSLTRRSSLVSRHLLEEFSPDRWRIPDSAVPLTNQVLLAFL